MKESPVIQLTRHPYPELNVMLPNLVSIVTLHLMINQFLLMILTLQCSISALIKEDVMFMIFDVQPDLEILELSCHFQLQYPSYSLILIVLIFI